MGKNLWRNQTQLGDQFSSGQWCDYDSRLLVYNISSSSFCLKIGLNHADIWCKEMKQAIGSMQRTCLDFVAHAEDLC